MERYWFVSRSCIVSSSAVSERVAGVHVGWAPEALPVLHHLIQLGPFIDVLLAHNVRVNEQVAVPHAEVLLAGCTLEALQVVYFVLHPHRHFEGSDPLVARGAQSVLAEQPIKNRTAQHFYCYGYFLLLIFHLFSPSPFHIQVLHEYHCLVARVNKTYSTR